MKEEKQGVERIVRETGLSRATISRALNNCGSVSSEVKEEVLRAARAVRYTPPQKTRVRRPEGGYLVAAALPEMPAYFWGDAMKGMRDRADDFAGMRLVHSLFSRLNSEADALYCIDYLLELRPDVLVVAPPAFESVRLRLLETEIPVVCFAESGEVRPRFFVGADYYRDGVLLARAAANALPERARLVKIEGDRMPMVNQRDEGFRRELMKCAPGMSWTGTVSMAGWNMAEAPARLARGLHDLSYDALYVSQGVLGQVMTALGKLKRLDVRVVGYERPGSRFEADQRLAAVVEQDIYGQGAACMDAVWRFLSEGQTPDGGKLFIESYLRRR